MQKSLIWWREVYTGGGRGKVSEEEIEGFFDLLLIVTFWKRMESKGRTEGERGVLSEKISSEDCREGLAKDGVEVGLQGGDKAEEGLGLGSGGKYASVKREGETEEG